MTNVVPFRREEGYLFFGAEIKVSAKSEEEAVEKLREWLELAQTQEIQVDIDFSDPIKETEFNSAISVIEIGM